MEALYDVDSSAALTAAERARVRELLGPVVRAVAQDERSQSLNRELAAERVVEQVRRAARPRRARTPTGPTTASRERRLEEKRARGRAKRLRRPPEADD